jgi:molybdate transport system regulatory protein
MIIPYSHRSGFKASSLLRNGGDLRYTDLVIAADSRKTGKTLLGCAITRLLRNRGVRAVKTSGAGSGNSPQPLSRGRGRKGSDTWRYSMAGAREAVLVRSRGLEELLELFEDETAADITIWESNRAAFVLPSGFLLVYILGAGSKARRGSAELQSMADLIPEGPLSDGERVDYLARLVVDMMESGLESCFGVVYRTHWLGRDGRRLLGHGRADLLEAVERTGSILKAARAIGVPYRRAWEMLAGARSELGARLVVSKRGGSSGGGSSLTRMGRALLEMYRSYEPDGGRQ